MGNEKFKVKNEKWVAMYMHVFKMNWLHFPNF